MNRLERVAAVAIVACLLLAATARPVARVVSPSYALWELCPLDRDDVLVAAVPASGASGRIASRDPWGREIAYGAKRVYSTGPNGIDERGAGDDLVVGGSHPLVTYAPAGLSGVAILIAWLWLVARALFVPRSEKLAIELVRAGILASLPTALSIFALPQLRGVALSFASAELLRAPPTVAVPGTIFFACYVVGLGLRHRRALELEADTVRHGRRAAVIGLALVFVAAVIAGALQDVRGGLRARRHLRFAAAAQLGLREEAQDVLLGSDREAARDLVRRMPPRIVIELADGDPRWLAAIAKLGREAVPVMAAALGSWPRKFSVNLATDAAPLEVLRRYDADFTALSAAIDAEPAAYRPLLLWNWEQLASSAGRRRVLGWLGRYLDDEAPLFQQEGGRPLLASQQAARCIQKLTSERFELPINEPGKPNDDAWSAAIARVRAFCAEPAPFASEGSLFVHGHGLTRAPGGGYALSVTLETRFGIRIDQQQAEVFLFYGRLPAGPHTAVCCDEVSGKSITVPLTIPDDKALKLDLDFRSGTSAVH